MLIKIGCGGYINNHLFMLEIPVNTDESYYRELHSLLKISPVKNKLCRMGKSGDGGYVMLNNFQHGRVAYSFGINDDVSWDADMVKYGYDIYMYDHTIEKLPYERKEFHFYKYGISSRNVGDLNTLKYFLQTNGHMSEDKMILKMDIEGAEWDVLANIEENILSKFSQVVVEFHGLLSVYDESREIVFSALKKLNAKHKLIHLHGNNMGNYICYDNRIIPDALEATYVRKDMPDILWSNEEVNLPLILDEPNDPYRPDLILGHWNAGG